MKKLTKLPLLCLFLILISSTGFTPNYDSNVEFKKVEDVLQGYFDGISITKKCAMHAHQITFYWKMV